MSDIASLLRTAQSLRASGEALVLATVVRIQGSAYRRPGARMLASERAWVAGSISGGCLERDVVQRGFFRTRATPAVVVRHDTTADDDVPAGGYSLGCDGVVDVLVERLGERMACDPLRFIADCHAEQTRGVIATVLHAGETAARVGDRLLLPARGCYRTTLGAEAANVARLAAGVLAAGKTVSHALEDGHLEVLFEVIEPPPHLFIFGAEHDALPVGCRYLPGNHDIGDNPTQVGTPPPQPASEPNRRCRSASIGRSRSRSRRAAPPPHDATPKRPRSRRGKRLALSPVAAEYWRSPAAPCWLS